MRYSQTYLWCNRFSCNWTGGHWTSWCIHLQREITSSRNVLSGNCNDGYRALIWILISINIVSSIRRIVLHSSHLHRKRCHAIEPSWDRFNGPFGWLLLPHICLPYFRSLFQIVSLCAIWLETTAKLRICFGICLELSQIVCHLKVNTRGVIRRNHPLAYLLVCVICSREWWSLNKWISKSLQTGFYWVFSIIITACYTSSIIAFVTLPLFPSTVDSINDLVSGFYRIGTFGKTFFIHLKSQIQRHFSAAKDGWQYWFTNSSHPQTRKLLKNLELVANIEEGLGNVTSAWIWGYAFLGSRTQLEYIVHNNFSDNFFWGSVTSAVIFDLQATKYDIPYKGSKSQRRSLTLKKNCWPQLALLFSRRRDRLSLTV